MISSTGRESLQITKAVMKGWGKVFRQEEEEEQAEEAAGTKASANKNAIGVFAIQTPQHFTYFG